MKVQDVMNREIETCSPDADLASAAMVMWRDDCGVVPVINEDNRLQGVITDRDICMAVATRHVPPEQIRVRDVMSAKVHTVRPEDDVFVLLDIMRRERVRRVPVAGRNGSLVGLVSINDLVLHASRGTGGLTADQILSVMKSVCEHRQTPHEGFVSLRAEATRSAEEVA